MDMKAELNHWVELQYQLSQFDGLNHPAEIALVTTILVKHPDTSFQDLTVRELVNCLNDARETLYPKQA